MTEALSLSTHFSSVLALDAFKGLLICCHPEDGHLPPLETLLSNPGVSRWEAAVSRSACDHGFLPVLARRVPTHIEHEADALLARLGLFGLVVVSPLSLNTLAKAALGIRDSLPARLIGAALDAGLPLLLDETGIAGVESLGNPHMVKVYRRHWETLRGGSVSSFQPQDFDLLVDRLARGRRAFERKNPIQGRGVITRDDVLAAHKAMCPLSVTRGAIVTDLAREEANALGVQLLDESDAPR
ncbi:MAG: flavoprotein [Candidatus Ozemobacteraceae bacterium]